MNSILIKNGKLLSGENISIGIKERKIVEISKVINEENYKRVIDLKGNKYISPGWIDAHTHCFNKYKLYSDRPDNVGYKSGVTTVVDAGTAGATTMNEFRESIKDQKTNVFAFINISKDGISSQDELSDLEKIDSELLKETIDNNRDFIVGIKVRMSKSVVGNNGIIPLEIAKELNRDTKLPLMVHIGSAPPKLEDVLNRLEKGDILSHCFNGKDNGILDENGEIKECFLESLEKGIHLDLAHGKDSFSFKVSKKALKENIKADIISSDIYEGNRVNGPVYSLVMTMNKMLYVGYNEKEIIDGVTKYPASILNLKNKGELKVGLDSDITIFEIRKGTINLIDSNKESVEGDKYFYPTAVLLNGEYISLEEDM